MKKQAALFMPIMIPTEEITKRELQLAQKRVIEKNKAKESNNVGAMVRATRDKRVSISAERPDTTACR